MAKKIVLVLTLVFGVFAGYVLGQKDPRTLPGSPYMFTGEDLAFQLDTPRGKMPEAGRRWVTGKLLVKINGQWVEARLGSGPGVVPLRK